MAEDYYNPIAKKDLLEKLDEISEKLETGKKKKKEKKFRLPLGIRLSQRKMRRQPYVIVCLIHTNGSVKFKMMKIEEDTIKIGEKFYQASSADILQYKRKPLLILTEWNMLPFSPRENFEAAAEAGTLTAVEKLIITKMKQEAIKSKMQINFKVILILLAVGAAGLYLLDYLKII